MKNKREKSPYKNFSIEQIAKAEADSYIIQIGKDLFVRNEYFAFSKKVSERYFDTINTGLRDLINNGNKRDREEASEAMLNLRILPYRVN